MRARVEIKERGQV